MIYRPSYVCATYTSWLIHSLCRQIFSEF